MYKLNFLKRVWIVKQYLKGVSVSRICLAQNISRMTVSNLVRSYKEFGWDGLKDHKTGRPETNGKVERFFLTYKKEYATGSFTNINEFITHYNNERSHMSLGYKTPKEVWDELNVK
ncbi:MAG: integrase core domain-containing protein [Candidatus Woesearchaeota archaeon]